MLAASLERRIAALEAEAAELRALLAGGKATAPVPQTQHQDREVSISTHVIDAPRAPLPSEKELRALMALVLRSYPQLRTSKGTDEMFASFSSAFDALALVGRVAQPDAKRMPTWWIDHLHGLLHSAGRSGREPIIVPTLVMAVLAHGDIAFYPLDRTPHDVSLGVGSYIGAPYCGAWRSVLSSGVLRRPIPRPKHNSFAEPSNIVISGGNRFVG